MKTTSAAVTILFLACTTAAPPPKYTSRYEIALTAVERQERGQKAQRFANIEANAFEDEYIKIHWRVLESQLAFELTNKTDSSARILWDEASFVGINGKSDRVIHEGVKIADRGAAMPPTVLIHGGTVDDVVEPDGNISWRSGYGYVAGGWEHEPLIGDAPSGSTEEEVKSKMVPAGATMKVLLPLDVNGTVREYLFEFAVEGKITAS